MHTPALLPRLLADKTETANNVTTRVWPWLLCWAAGPTASIAELEWVCIVTKHNVHGGPCEPFCIFDCHMPPVTPSMSVSVGLGTVPGMAAGAHEEM